jgi:hypothetical protein
MNTDRLVDLLSANAQPLGPVRLERTVLLAVAIGGLAALVVMLATVGPRPQVDSWTHLEWCAVKLLFALGVVGATTPILIRSARPGPSNAAHSFLVFLPFVAVWIAAFAALLLSPPEMRAAMLRGATAVSPARCLLCIIGFSAVPLIALIRVLRGCAPTQLSACGALAGLVAGGLGAAAYAVACLSDSVPFIAVWYGAAIALYAGLGALLGPRLLRW